MTRDNHLLGKFDLTGIPPAPRGVPQIEVTLDIDANGILNLSARDGGSGRSNQIQIKNDKGRLSQDEIQRMLKDAERFKNDDEKQRDRISSKNKLESYIFGVKQALSENKTSSLSSSEKSKIEDYCNKELKWLDANQTADKEEYEFHYKEISRKCSPVMSKLHNSNGPKVEEVD